MKLGHLPPYIIVIPESLAYHIEVKPQEIQEDDYGTENQRRSPGLHR